MVTSTPAARWESDRLVPVGYRRRSFGVIAVGMCVALTGCGPSAVNIELRKKNQDLQSQVDKLSAQQERDAAALAACQRSHPTESTLSPEQLDQLFTTHDLSFGKLTGGDNPDSTQGADTELKVYIAPVDEQGTPIKAAGSFKVEAFDLGDPGKPLLGTWTFDLKQSRELFFSRFAMYQYVLPCPWQVVPTHADVTVRVTFNDALTGRQFISQIQAKVRPPAGK